METKHDARPERVPQRTWLVGCLVLSTVSLAAIAILAVLGITVGWQTYEQVWSDASRRTAECAELTAAQAEHNKILAISKECPTHGALELDDGFTVITSSGGRMCGPPAIPSVPTPLASSGYLLAAIHLSAEISQTRVDLARQQVFEDITMQVFTWVGVLVGALTTILIAVKSMTNEGMRFQFSIGVAAIVFSALGTAVAGLNSFYTPKIAYDTTTRSLASLRQLHEELATGMTRSEKDSLCKDWKAASWSNDWRYKRIKGLTDQYIAVVAAMQLITPQPEGPTTEQPSSPESDDLLKHKVSRH